MDASAFRARCQNRGTELERKTNFHPCSVRIPSECWQENAHLQDKFVAIATRKEISFWLSQLRIRAFWHTHCLYIPSDL